MEKGENRVEKEIRAKRKGHKTIGNSEDQRESCSFQQ